MNLLPLVLVPSVRANGVDTAVALRRDLDGVADVVCVANSGVALERAKAASLETVTYGENLGYGRALTRSAGDLADRPAVWLVNDDIASWDAAAFRSLVQSSSIGEDQRWITVALGPGARVRPLPGPLRIALDLSLLSGVLATVRRAVLRRDARSDPAPDACVPRRGYAPFVVAGISSDAWRELGGFDPSLCLYFEDADFCRRAEEAGVRRRVVALTYDHQHSATTRSLVEMAIPAAAASAVHYLERWCPRSPARVVVGLALVMRLPLCLVHTGVSRAAEIRGTLRAIGTVALRRSPQLQGWDAAA